MNAPRRSVLVLALLVVLVPLVLAGCGPKAPASVRLGIVGPFTGSVAYYGNLMKQGGLLAVDEINKAGGVNLGGKKVPIEAFPVDDAGKPAESVAAVEKLVTQDKVVIVIGAYLSSCTLANLEVTGRYNITQIVPIAVADAITTGHPWVFRNCPNQSMQTGQMAVWAVEKSGLKSFALFLQNDDYGRGGGEVFRKAAEKAGVQIVTTEYFNLGDTDFSTQLTKIKSLNPEGIFLVALVTEGSQIVKQARSMGMTQQFFGLGGFASQKFLELAGDAAEGMIHVSYWEPDPNNPKSLEFAKAMPAFSGMEAEMFSAATYDAVYIAKEVLEKAGCASQEAECQEKIRKALHAMDYTGVQGRTYFDAEGQGQLCFYIVRVQGGKRTIIDKACPGGS